MSKLPVTVLFLSMHGYAFVACQLLKFFLRERILGRIQHSLRLVEIQIFYSYANVLEYFVQSLAEVSECYGTVVREVLLDQYVTVETPISGIAKTPIPPKELVATGRTSPCAT